MPHFRGCSGELNLAPRAYHSGDYEEVGWILARMRAQRGAPVIAVGISLGGNALLRWAEEAGDGAHALTARRGGGVLAARPGRRRPRDRPRLQPAGLHAHVPAHDEAARRCAKLAQHPGLFDRERLLRRAHLYEFDNVFTAPLHGFRDTDDYWTRASAKPHLARIRIPALVLNARNDPFVPATQPAAAARGGRARHAVAAGARRPRGLPRRRFPGPCA